MFIELHRTFTGETVIIKTDSILYVRDSFYYLPGKFEPEKGTEVCLNGYDCVYESERHVRKTRIRFGVIETVEQISEMLSINK